MTTIPTHPPIQNPGELAGCTVATEVATRLVRRQLDKIGACISALHKQDVEAIHDVRVASRRLRAALREFKSIAKGKPSKRLRKNAKKMTGRLGEGRELDVCLELLSRLATDDDLREKAEPLRIHLEGLREQTRGAVQSIAELIASSRFRSTGLKAARELRAGDSCLLAEAPARVDAAATKLGEAHARWEDAHTDDSLHAVRIRLKKLRYFCEIYDPAISGGLQRELKTMKRAQGLLGDWNDARVLSDRAITFGANQEILETIEAEVHQRMSAIENGLDVPAIVARLANIPVPESTECCRDTRAHVGANND